MRPLNARIRLDNLRHNYQTLKQIHGGKMLAVIKADAYGHGAVRCAHALSDLADGFAVATVDEAVELRENGITNPIVLLEGVFEASEYATVNKYNLWPGVGSQWQLEALIAHHWQNPVKVWLKMDSGMHRAGFFPAQLHFRLHRPETMQTRRRHRQIQPLRLRRRTRQRHDRNAA